jgi:hypothetical protein
MQMADATEEALIRYFTQLQMNTTGQLQLREALESVDRTYMREVDLTTQQLAARNANSRGDPTQFQNITVPVVMPQVESALAYYMNVFLTQYPIFKVVSTPGNADASSMMQAIIEENSVRAGWARQLLLAFRDGLKYNMQAVECSWDSMTSMNIGNSRDNPGKSEVRRELWKGNVLRRIDPYNVFFDPRVPLPDMHVDGEFVGYHTIMSRPRFKQYANELSGVTDAPRINQALRSKHGNSAPAAFSSATTPFSYYIPSVNPFPLGNANQQMDWMAWAHDLPYKSGRTVDYANSYLVTRVYCRITPSDFGMNVPGPNTPQVWKFVVVNGNCILHYERLPNVHNFIPVFFGQPMEDGLGLQTKSFAQNATDFQSVASAMMNGFIASKRRLIGDRVLYDPLRVRGEDINNSNPAAKIPVRQGAYGKPVSEAVYQFPYRDEATASLLQGFQLATQMADKVNGQNPAQQGQFVKGNKTQTEYMDIMGHGNSRNQAMALMTELQMLAPLKETIKLNTMQFQEDGDVMRPSTGETVTVDMLTLRQKAVQFEIGDGILPADKIMHMDVFTTAVQVIGSSPQLASGYNLAPLFSYIMKQQGADLAPFEKSEAQRNYEQQMAVWQQAAAEAAKTGAQFSTPMPTPPQEPTPQQKQQQEARTPTVHGRIATQGGTNGATTSNNVPAVPVQRGGPGGAAVQPGAGAADTAPHRPTR